MKIYPAIDMKNRLCVRLTQGDYDKMTVYGQDPVKVALQWEKMGAEALHLVDLDGARNGRRVNEPVVREIQSQVKIPLQLGGGIRDTQGVKDFIDLGISRVIIGTAALKNPQWIREIIQDYGQRIVVSIDATEGWIATDGWESVSGVRALDYIKTLESYGLKRLVYTDIARDGMLMGPNFKMYDELLKGTSLEVIASGGITTLEDVRTLSAMGLYGAIIGKALYDGKLSLREVLEC
ncbi:MAG: 1-(5-phosphoribosyl)-5-((5-phosphoribosylamino)methylideneamino)imidazole-4-carboxamide isomerase [delta proteobacterium ML8_F1]|nr:MAG: 1-(5-phosphoribosyl)-5-((5-phosphoribosylamino)methylideneamino)imidazole-4-carboxamide isomerase [delta proteobacterium ML8_F1]